MRSFLNIDSNLFVLQSHFSLSFSNSITIMSTPHFVCHSHVRSYPSDFHQVKMRNHHRTIFAAKQFNSPK